MTLSGSCPNDSPWALCYRLSIGTILLYLALFHFPRYLAQKLWESLLRDDVIRPNDVIRPGSTKTI